MAGGFLIGRVVTMDVAAVANRARVIDLQFDQKTGFWQLLVFIEESGRLASWRADTCYLLPVGPVEVRLTIPEVAS